MEVLLSKSKVQKGQRGDVMVDGHLKMAQVMMGEILENLAMLSKSESHRPHKATRKGCR